MAGSIAEVHDRGGRMQRLRITATLQAGANDQVSSGIVDGEIVGIHVDHGGATANYTLAATDAAGRDIFRGNAGTIAAPGTPLELTKDTHYDGGWPVAESPITLAITGGGSGTPVIDIFYR